MFHDRCRSRRWSGPVHPVLHFSCQFALLVKSHVPYTEFNNITRFVKIKRSLLNIFLVLVFSLSFLKFPNSSSRENWAWLRFFLRFSQKFCERILFDTHHLKNLKLGYRVRVLRFFYKCCCERRERESRCRDVKQCRLTRRGLLSLESF